MRTLSLVLSGLALCIGSGGLFLAGCGGQGGGGTTVPLIQRGQGWTAATTAAHRSQSQSLLYVSDNQAGTVNVYGYPKGGPLIGKLTGFIYPSGLCSDHQGNVWVTNSGASQLVEYAHEGSMPIATLVDGDAYPYGCSIDPITGNLAVSNYSSSGSSGPGDVVIFARARGKPKTYTDLRFARYGFCGYDNNGNLFVDGLNSKDKFQLAELPAGGSSFVDISIRTATSFGDGAIQWDGKYLAIGVRGTEIARISVSGSEATVIGETSFLGSRNLAQFWIQGNHVIGAHQVSNATEDVWRYPGGHRPTAKVSGLIEPFGATVSTAPSAKVTGLLHR